MGRKWKFVGLDWGNYVQSQSIGAEEVTKVGGSIYFLTPIVYIDLPRQDEALGSLQVSTTVML